MQLRTTVSTLFLLALTALLAPGTALAGGYMFAVETGSTDTVTHPSGYDGSGGTLTVTVCIDPDSDNASAMEIPTQNVIRTWNARVPTTGNTVFPAPDFPFTSYDYESLLLHEMGHCIGVSHPALGSESGLGAGDRDYTRSTNGGDSYDLNAGSDGLIATPDDVRGNDVNLNWFRIGINNPFLTSLPAFLDASNFSQLLGDLPGSDNYAAGGSRIVAADFGFSDTEAVMHQGQSNAESQRTLTADELAMVRYAESGLDESDGNSDDYDLVLSYSGLTASCDIVIDSKITGFGNCMLSASFLGSNNHVRITAASLTYNSTGFSWYFNQVSNEVIEPGPFVPSVPSLRPFGFAAVGLLLAVAGVLALRIRSRSG